MFFDVAFDALGHALHFRRGGGFKKFCQWDFNKLHQCYRSIFTMIHDFSFILEMLLETALGKMQKTAIP